MTENKYALILNKALDAGKSLDHLDIKLTANLSKGMVRNEQLEGRSHTVVPMVMIVEGVLNGSNGALLYPGEELAKVPQVWNHKPVVVYHPEGGSACEPDVLNTSKVGVILNTKFEDGRLTAEAWLDDNRLGEVDDRVAAAVANQSMLELSTGLFLEREENAGVYNGKDYVAVTRNYRPDHLAILPDQIGACSVADGAGFIRNQLGVEPVVWDRIANNDQVKAFRSQLDELIANELEVEAVWPQLRNQIKARLLLGGDPDPSCWIEGIYQTFVIYEYKGKFWKLGYTIAGNTASLSEEEPTSVTKVVEWRTPDGAVVNKAAFKATKNKNMKKLVNSLIANHGYAEDDRESLMALNEAVLQRMISNAEAATQNNDEGEDTGASEGGGQSEDETGEEAATQNQEGPQTVDDYISAAPEGIRDVLNASILEHNRKKAKLVKGIFANKANRFTEQALNAKPLEELEAIASFANNAAPAPKPAATYAGQGGITESTENSETTVEPMDTPTLFDSQS